MSISLDHGNELAVRVRFAPSPTGYLHVGGARTALYNWLYAKNTGGKFILRIEDTDEVRSSEESLRGLIQDLQWMGLGWDEGPDPLTLEDRGSFGPYRQSERKDRYQQVAQDLLKSGLAYYCFMTDIEIEEQKKKNENDGVHAHLHSPYADWPLTHAQDKLKSGASAVVRFKTQNLKRDYILRDLIRAEVRFPSDMVGDFVLLRSDGMPVYNFCCAVDDHDMKISHVIRAEEHLPNTLRQMMIYEACGWELPKFGHVSLVLDEDRQKLSKRKGAVSCTQYREQGYLPEALSNFILLLGWTHPEGKEVLTRKEMIEHFSLDRLHVAGAIFDRVKLKWLNSMHLRALPSQELWSHIQPFLDQKGISYSGDRDWQLKSVEAFRSYLETFADAPEYYGPLDDKRFAIAQESKETLSWPSTRFVLEAWLNLLEALSQSHINEQEFLKLQDQVKEITRSKGKNLFMPIRVAVIGKPQGTELKILVPLIAVSSLKERAKKALSQVP